MDKTNTLQPDWANAPTLKDLEADYIAASDSQEEIRDELKKWELARDGGKPINARPGKSTVRPKVIRTTEEWMIPAFSEPFLNSDKMFEVRGRTFEDVEGAEKNALILNYQWSVKVDKVQLVGDIIRANIEDGTVIVKTGWEVEETMVTVQEEQPVYADAEQSLAMLEQAVLAGQMSPEEASVYMEEGAPLQIGTELVDVEVPKITKNQPTYEVCNTANVTIDPTCKGYMDRAKFVIHEYDTNWSELKTKEYFKDEETGEITGIYQNIESIKDIETGDYYDEHETQAYNNFEFNDKARKVLRAYDYWGYWDINGDGVLVCIIATWVNNVLIRLEENPFPHKRLPFSMATYMPRRKSVTGEPNAELLMDIQDGTGKLIRAIHDTTSAQAVGQEFIDERLLNTQAQKNAYDKGNTVYTQGGVNPKTAIHRTTVDPLPSTVFNVLDMYGAQQESISGTKAFTGGISGQALGNSATGIRSTLDATSKRELDVLRRLSALFRDMARLTISMNQAYLEPEETIRITNKEFVEIRRDDIQGEYDTIVDVSTPEKDADTAEKLNMLMQTNAAHMDPKLAAKILARIAKLWNQVDLSEDIATFEPEPDPGQQKLQELQLQNAELQNQILQMDLQVKSKNVEKIASDIQYQNTVGISKAQVEIDKDVAQTDENTARAEKLRAETDVIDAGYLADQDGTKRYREIEDMQYAEESKSARESAKNQTLLDNKVVGEK